MLGCTGPKYVSDKDIRTISLGELRQLMAEDVSSGGGVLVIVDPRQRERYNAGHLPQARNIMLPEQTFERGKDPELAGHAHIVVYGDDPGSAPAMAMTKRLMSMRYRGVRWYEPGIREWVSAGLPLVTESRTEGGAEGPGGR